MPITLHEMPSEARPRERLQNVGAASLRDIELLALLLGSGTKKKGVMRLAQELLAYLDSHLHSLEPRDLQRFCGVGAAKACTIVAALEFARRRIRPKGVRIKTASDIYPLVQHLGDRTQEHFLCVSLNGAHEVIKTTTITIGLANSTQVHPREVFSGALTDRACAVIVAHNHPSGNLQPSEEDKRATHMLKEAGGILGIQLLDHLIFGETGFFSFAEHGLL